MARIPTFIPQSVRQGLGRIFSGTVLDILWKLFVIALLLGAVTLMAASGGFFLAAVAGIILSTLIADDVQQLVSDVWNRNFWVFRT